MFANSQNVVIYAQVEKANFSKDPNKLILIEETGSVYLVDFEQKLMPVGVAEKINYRGEFGTNTNSLGKKFVPMNN